MKLKDEYDIAIIGSGPAGLAACYEILQTSSPPSILLIDKWTPWEHTVACAEAVGRLGFEKTMGTAPQSWIRYHISKAEFHPPNGPSITYTDSNKGFILNRRVMYQELVQKFQNSGVSCYFESAVTTVTHMVNGNRRLYFSNGTSVNSRVVIDASGPLSRFGRDEGIHWKPYDLEPAYFAVVEGIQIPADTVHLYVGQKIAPGGYAWVFPRDATTVNAGLLFGRKQCRQLNIRSALNKFIFERFPKAKCLYYLSGAIPCGYRRSTLAIAGLFKAGDSACTTNPISRAGIVEAMICGRLAGHFAIEMLGALSERKIKQICIEYEKAWYKKLGRKHAAMAKVKDYFSAIPDADYDHGAQALSKIPENELTMLKIFAVAVGRFPKLVWALRNLL